MAGGVEGERQLNSNLGHCWTATQTELYAWTVDCGATGWLTAHCSQSEEEGESWGAPVIYNVTTDSSHLSCEHSLT